MTDVVRFDDAFSRAVEFAKAHVRALVAVTIVRDLLGRVYLFVAADEVEPSLQSELATSLGAFSPGPAVGLSPISDLISPAIIESPDAYEVAPHVRVVERVVTGSDWVRDALPRSSTARRVSFFSIKGGVGRTTALVAVARHLAENNHRVLVVDLDLESPGVTAALLQPEARPTFGVVDWFAEGGVGQADAALVRDMYVSSPLASGTGGEILVCPALGSAGAAGYTAKLGRVYASPPGGPPFAERLGHLVEALEVETGATFTLLDSRTGIDDVAATTVTRLRAATLVFAIDTPQTWLSYELLFHAWRRDPVLLDRFRADLQIVAAQVPELDRDQYLGRLRSHALTLFSEFLYEEADADDVEAFNFDVDDEEAPHFAIPVYWRRELQGWDPLRDEVTADQVMATFGSLFRYVDDMLGGGPVSP